jgi:hypothetical protein
MYVGYWWESQMERDHWEDQDLGGCNVRMYLREIGWDVMDLFDVAQDSDQWRAPLNMVKYLPIS